MPIKINNKTFEAVVDTGSSLSFVNSKTTYMLDINGRLDQEVLIRLLDQTIIRINEVVILKVDYQNQSVEHQFYVFWKMKYPVLIGMDLLKKMEFKINFNEKVVENPFENLEVDPMIEKNEIELILERNQVIKPRKETIIQNLETADNIYLELFEHEGNSIKYNYIVKVVHTPIEIQIILINNNFSKLYLPIGLKIGKFIIKEKQKTPENTCLNITAENVVTKLNLQNPDLDLNSLIREFSYIFAEDLAELKKATHVKHVIDTGDAQPIRSVPYRTSYKEREIIEKEVNKMLKNKIISISHSPWSSPVVLVTKKDGSTRFCVDYRRLNSITKKDSHPLPLIAETLDQLNDAKIFTKLDCKSGYYSIAMDENSKEKTAFVCHLGLFHFEVMPFGLTNAPSTFQRYISHVLNEYLWRFALVYIDDIIIYSKNMKEHIEHIRLVFEKLAKYQLRLNVEKCEFASDKVYYLGHVISKDGIFPGPEKIEAVENFPTPKRLRDLRGFLGLTSYYRKFIQDYSKIAKPLFKLLTKSTRFIWDKDCEESFQELKKRLITPPILAHFKPECPIILYVDACDYAVGCVLSQIQDGKEVVISYNSQTVLPHQRNYSVVEKELLAIVWAVQKLRPYLFGVHFDIKTDNDALTYIMKARTQNGRLMRWSLILQPYDFTIIYRNGKIHKNADFMSRYPCKDNDADLEEIENLSIEDLRIAEAQKHDKEIKAIINEIKEKKNKKYLSGYRIENGILYRIIYTTNKEPLVLLYVPKCLRSIILSELHSDQLSSHQGFIRTYVKVRERFYWKYMGRTISDFITKCPECQLRKPSRGLPPGDLQNIEYIKEAFYQCSMDVVGKLSITPRKNEYIIVFIDFCTKYMEAKPLKNIRSETIADFFVNEILCRHGAVVKILTDMGRSFCSEFTEAVFKLTKSEHITTTPYSPQCNGLVERAIRSIRQMMSFYINEHHNNWDLYLTKLVFAYNTSRQTSTGETPFFLLYGRECRLPIDVTFELPNRFRFGRRYKESMDECFELVNIRVKDAQQRQKAEYDARHFNAIYSVGDLVAIRKHTRSPGMTEKLFKSWDGPFQITRKIGQVSYELKNIRYPRRKLKKIHIQHMKRWHVGAIEGLEDPDNIERDFRDDPHKALEEELVNRKKFVKANALKDLLDDDPKVSSKGNGGADQVNDTGDGLEIADFSDVKADVGTEVQSTTSSNDSDGSNDEFI